MSGNAFPIHLQSFFWSPAGYSYSSIPFIWLLGLSEFSSRFASALFGSLSVIVTFFFVRELLLSEIKLKESALIISREINKIEIVALLSSLILAISPWHINASRIGIEITLVVVLLTSGALSFLIYAKSKRLLPLFITFLLFATSFTVYQSPRAFVPFIIPVLFYWYRKGVSIKHWVLSGILYGMFIILPLLLILNSPILSLRIQSLSVFTSPHAQLKVDESIREDGMIKTKPLIARILHNKVEGYGNEIFNNYIAHFSFDFFFRDKAFPTRMTIFDAGNMYIVELVFLLFGVYIIVTRRTRPYIIIGLWILLAPLGSALTYDDVPNMQRTLLMHPALSIVVALGIYSFFNKIRTKPYLIFPAIVLILIYAYNMAQYLDSYYVHQPIKSAQFRNAGYKELVEEVTKRSSQFKRTIITNAESAPSVFFLFFTSYDPLSYQNETKLVDKNKSDSINFSSFEFESDDCPLNSRLGITKNMPYMPKILSAEDKSSLFVQYRDCPLASQSAELLHTIYLPNGQEVFQLLQTK